VTDAEGSRAVPRGFMLLVGSFVALAPLSTDFYLPVLPAIADDLDATASQTQLMITAVLLGLALGQLVGGPLSDQRGRRGTLLLGLLGFVVTSALSAAAPTIGALVAIRFVSGLAAALAFVVARAMVADVFPGVAAARAYALLGSITGIAPVVAPIAGGLLALVMDWRGIFLVLAAIGIVIAALAWFRVPETMPPHARQQVGVSHGLRDLGACLRSRPFMTYVACTAMGGGVLFTYISSSPFVLQGSYGLTPTMYSAVFAMNSVGIFVVALIGRRLVTTHGPARMLWGGQAIAVTGSAIVLAGLLSDLLPVILVGLLVAISSIGLVFANSLALGIRVSPVRAGSASALLGISGFLVGGLLAPLGGLGGAAMGVLMLAFAAGGLVLHRMLGVPTLEVTGP
jgi:DHA1 family bicyclomycin/chloramphenicol resistance-like MFS transporter